MEVGNSNNNTMVDETYEFSAPKFFDFVHGETDEEMEIAQHWFETALSYAPSPFMPRIKESRSIKIESLCDFSDVEHVKKDDGSLIPEGENSTRLLSEVVVAPAEDKRISIISEDIVLEFRHLHNFTNAATRLRETTQRLLRMLL